jgi:pyruvate dehydrogenase E2 component (dihydrolipoamide acetyltransferase)
MATEIIMPKLGVTMSEGSIVRWMKQDGDTVTKDEPLFEVQTDKVVLEVESPDDGVLKILTGEGIIVPVLVIIGWILAPGEEVPEGVAVEPDDVQASPEAAPVATTEITTAGTATAAPPAGGRVLASPAAKRIARETGVDLAAVTGTGPGGRVVARDVEAAAESLRVKASPVARRIAQEAGLDLSKITGTGPGGRIVKEDVEREKAKPAPAPVVPVEAETIPVAGIRKVIFERMAQSSNTVARVTEFVEVDATNLVEMRTYLKAELQKTEDLSVGYNDLLIMIVAKSLKEHRLVNSTVVDGEIRLLPQVNVGLAVDTERGLIVPVIRDADSKGLVEIVHDVRALISRALEGTSLPDDLTGGTFTITNLGMYEIDGFTPIVNLPESAILGVGRIQAKPVVYEGEIAIRQMMMLSLSFDHRSIDGGPAARFLQRVKHLVENPYLLLM